MDILVDATGITPQGTGLGKYSLYLLKALVCHESHHYTVLHRPLPAYHELYSLGGGHVKLVQFDVPVVGPRRELTYARMASKVRRHDLYHCLSSYLPNLGNLGTSVVTVHDLKYIKYPALLENRWKANYLRHTMLRGIRKATRIIAVSEWTKADLVEFGADPSRIRVVHEACPLENASPQGRHSQGCCRKHFLFVGENRPHKNLVKLLKAYRQVVEANPNGTPALVIAGRGVSELQETARGLGVIGRISLMDHASDDEIRRLYEEALALVFPTLYEGFGLPVLEAMSVGTPVITSFGTSTEEVAGGAAMLVDPYSVDEIGRAMAKISGDGALREQLRIRGLERARGFSWERVADETLSVYDEAIGDGRCS